MTSHSVHPDSHTYGLADGCSRCEEHAFLPWAGLDNENLGVLARRLALGQLERSRNERTAMSRLLAAINAPGAKA